MEAISKIVAFITNIFRFHKMKIAATLLFSVLFSIMMFPYDDLAEVITAKVSEVSGNQVFLQFDNLGLQAFPFPALAIENVTIDSTLMPSIAANRLAIAPSLWSLITFRPGFKVGASGIWDGDAELVMKPAGKNSEGQTLNSIDAEVEQIDLAKMAEVASLPIRLQGKATADISGKFDPTFAAQPEGEMQLVLNSPRLSPSSIPTAMGALSLPGLSWQDIVVKGRLVNSKFLIDEFKVGENKDLLNGTVRGEFELRFTGSGQPIMGGYNLVVDLNVNSRLEKDLVAFLLFVDKFKTRTTTGSRYRFQASAPRSGIPPSLGPAPAQ